MNEEDLNKAIEWKEFREAIGNMKNNKAAGSDGLRIEFIKGHAILLENNNVENDTKKL